MKTQVAWSVRRSRTELRVSPRRGEALDVDDADWLGSQREGALIPADYDPELADSRRLVLAYDVTGLVPLKRRLARVWSQDGYYALLEGIERAAATCTDAGRLVERVLFDLEHVYLDESGEPRFVYVPLSGVAFDAGRNSPLLVLSALAGGRLRFDSSACAETAARLRRFVLATRVFSLGAYRGFLDGEFPELRRARTAPSTAWNAPVPVPGTREQAELDALFSGFGAVEDEPR